MEKATDFGILICSLIIGIPLWFIAVEMERIRKKMKP